MKTSAGSRYRLVRWCVLVMALAIGVALLATAWSSYSAVHRASETVVRGQGEAVVHPVLRILSNLEHPVTQADLDDLVAQFSDLGLRYVALFDDAGRLRAAAGDTNASSAQLEQECASASPGVMRESESRVRMYLRPPPGEPSPTVDRGGRPSRPPIVFEFEPFIAKRLEGEAGAVLVVGIVAAAVLVIGGLIVWRLILRTETLARRSEQEARLAALGTMSAVLAHEIRNPLASLKGHAQLMLEETLETDRLRSKAERVVTETLRLESLTTTLLDFARCGEIDRRMASPEELIQRARHECNAARYTLRLEDAPAQWSLDPLRMHQVLVNLLRNAAQASPADAAVEVAAFAAHGRLVIEVRDHGEGIPRESAERMFEPFVTTRVRGTGLGLAVAKRIVMLHGGVIDAQNHPEGGAVVRIEIPAGEGD